MQLVNKLAVVLVCFTLIHVQSVTMEISDWLGVRASWKAVLNYATVDCGAQCAGVDGTRLMQQWCAGSWDSQASVCCYSHA